MTDATIKDAVLEKYSQAALRVGTSCCGQAAASCNSLITSNLYADHETGELPEAAVLASLGCGNPTALAELKPGETVLDLGSGGGIDVLLSARRVGPTGKAYGLDMTDEMLALARENQRKAGVQNVEFLKGEIEAIPLPDDSQDAVTSIFLFHELPPKVRRSALRECARVLKSGGRLIVLDSLQHDDRADYEGMLELFPQSYHEPYYASYLKEDFPTLAADYGLSHIRSVSAFLSKVMAFDKMA